MLKNELKIADTSVGGAATPYVIAEVGSNFDKNLDKARKLIDVAAEAGANAVKFQLFRADFLYPNGGEIYDIFKSIELDPRLGATIRQARARSGPAFLGFSFRYEVCR